MHNTEDATKNLTFFSKLEKSLKCQFKYTSAIINSEENEKDIASINAERIAQEEARLDKIASNLKKYSLDTARISP